MQHLLVTIADNINLDTLTILFMKMKGVEHVEPIVSNENVQEEPDLKDRLHLPGPPLTDAQLEELVADMEAETIFFTLEEAKSITLQNLTAWKQSSSSK
jgi:hypothetical protein